MFRDFRKMSGAFFMRVTFLIWAMTLATLAQAAEDFSAERLDELVRQLNDSQTAQRDEAEASLLKLAPADDAEACGRLLKLLPRPIDGMPEEVQNRLTRIRQLVESRAADFAVSASRFSLSADAMDLATVLEKIHVQTGNRLEDQRQQFGQNARQQVTVDVDDEFWPALDKVLDAAELGLYSFSGENALAVISREPGAQPRSGRVSYAGPFRVEAVNVIAQKNLRIADQQGTRLELEIAWEPRLRPIAISQSVEQITAVANDGSKLPLDSPHAVLDVEVQPGSHATELTIPLALPARNITTITSFRGQLSALVPGRMVEFQFSNLEEARDVEQQQGGVKVVLDQVRKNRALWEVHMRIVVESEEAALESHRGWVFQNLTYLTNDKGEIIDHAGFETTRQTKREVGLAYFFDVPEGTIGQYSWVYRTPAAIVRVPIDYELKEIPLP